MPKPLTVWTTTNCGKFLKRREYQTSRPASWEIYVQVRKQQLELDMEEQTGSKSGKKYVKAVYCHPAYLTYMQCTSYEIPGWMNHKLKARLPREISTTSDMQLIYRPNGRKWRGTMEPLDEGVEEREKASLKLNIQKTKVMASDPITSWQIDGETVETVTDFFFFPLDSKWLQTVTAAMKLKDAFSLEESSDKPSQCNKRQRYHFADKILYSQSYGFSRSDVWMWELDHKEGWVSKNWCFQILVFEEILRVPETARRSNQLIVEKINPKIHWKNWCFSWSSNTLVTWCVEQTHWRDCDAGKNWRQEEGGSKGWDG